VAARSTTYSNEDKRKHGSLHMVRLRWAISMPNHNITVRRMQMSRVTATEEICCWHTPQLAKVPQLLVHYYQNL
jgi:hypothetical protein